MTAQTYQTVAATYDSNAAASAVRRVYDLVTMHEIGRRLPRSRSDVLDAGGGTGRLSIEIARAGHRVTLLDPSREMLQEAAAKPDGRRALSIVQGGLESLSLRSASYDLVVCEGDPLGYCADRAAAAREIVRVLRPGGTFYVSVDNRATSTLAFLARREPARAVRAWRTGDTVDPYESPIHAFTVEELRTLFVDAGAEGVEVRGKVVYAQHLGEAALARMGVEEARALLELELDATRDPAMAGAGGHLQVVGRRPGGRPHGA